ncbi:hypothetical protein WMW72_21435 [Paenibacillus filicis]|uniref:Phage protein n=1 Tax=Paenibacillus filicis TaxID=669464 RepID=A0ABU9DNM6_9BACL
MIRKKFPDITDFFEIAEKYGISVDERHNPSEGFEFYELEKQSAFSCDIVGDLELFSIDFQNPDESMLNALKDVLIKYGIPTETLIKDSMMCYNNREYITTEYETYWVDFIPHDDNEILLIRYRQFQR